ncbi:MAG: carbohydrate binding family 9 domain-containing protein [Planctomycetota bacterium]
MREDPAPNTETAPPALIGGQKRIQATRVEEPPTIDGVLDEGVWSEAPVIDDLLQYIPEEGVEASERTEVRVLYDSKNLYFGVWGFDSSPDEIVATQLRRDAAMFSDSRIVITLDPFYSRRDGYLFEISAAGAKRDALIENNRNFRFDWDGIWFARTTRDEHGWYAEVRIPLNTLSFDPSTDVWGVNFTRVIKRKNEFVRWSTPTRNSGEQRLVDAGRLEGLEGLEQGIGLDIKPSVSLSFEEEGKSFVGTPSLDVFYQLSPNVTAALTLNTDFAETEVDDRQINLTRFPLFFPEKRDFFLQDAGLFGFGSIQSSPLPFFSRRIGIVNGQEKDILVGTKLTGRTDDWSFGVLNVQMKSDDVLGDKNLSVLRGKYNLTDTTAVGVIGTNGNPSSRGENQVFGVDFDFLDASWSGSNAMEASGYFQQSFTSGTNDPGGGDDIALGGRFSLPNEPWWFFFGFDQIGEDFNPALGFVRRHGVRQYVGNVRYRHRPEGSWVRRMDYRARTDVTTNLSGTVESSSSTPLHFEIENQRGDFAGVYVSAQRENLFGTFEISPGVVLPAGAYDFARGRVFVGTSSSRPVNVFVSLRAGEFYNGHREDYGMEIGWRPSPRFQALFNFDQSQVTLDQGDFITRLARARFDVAFSPNVSWSNLVQYDNVSDTAGVNSRVRWIFKPGNDVFVVYNQGFDATSDRIEPHPAEFTVKVGLNFRF